MVKITDALIYFSNRCNLDCTYCFVPKEYEQRLSWKQINDFLIWFLSQPADFKRIGTAGGEPLLELDLIKKMVFLLKKNKIYDYQKIIITDISTNGTILNEGIFDFLKKERIGLNFSIDGDLESNLNRRFKDGRDCFDVVWDNMIKYKDEIGQPLISMTITPNNVHKFYSNVKLFLNNGFYRIKFSPAVVFGKWSNRDVNIFINEFKKVVTYYLSFKKDRSEIPLVFLESLSNRIKKEGFFNCSLGRQFVLSYDGNIYACPLIHSFSQELRKLALLGRLPGRVDLEKLNSLRNLNYLEACGLKNNYNHPYIRELCIMPCLLFEKHGILSDKKYVKNAIKLYLRIYEVISKTFHRRLS